MKIVFTHNLQLSGSEDEAEFDRPETVAAITAALRRLGHKVEPIDVAGPASRVVARLEALNPDLIFNTAEGTQGRFREAFYPALFDRLGLPFTGSDAYVCALTLDKRLTKMMVASCGVPTPRWIFIERMEQLSTEVDKYIRFPVIVKPNFEGSSMGISVDSIVETPSRLRERVQTVLERYPEGVIVEEFIIGNDLTVPYLEKAPTDSGVLEPAQYEFNGEFASSRKYEIYDYEMKSIHSDAVKVRVPSSITPAQRALVVDFTKKVVRELNIRDAARIDYRITEDGEIYFIEINALPSFEPGASIYCSSALLGLDTVDKVMGAIVESAAERYGLAYPLVKRGRRQARARVGLTFNLKRIENSLEQSVDNEAEFDSPETITAIRNAIESYGHEVVELEATRELPSILPSSGVDVVFNIAEGFEGRTRESQVPALLELLDIPYTGSDPTTISLSHDKALAKRLVSGMGIKTSPFCLMTTGKERVPKELSFPVIVKPVAEGSSKGILRKSLANTEAELREVVIEAIAKYRQAVLVESFLPGREFTVALLGERRPRALPPLEVIFPDKDKMKAIYSFESKFFDKDIRFEAPAKVSPDLKRELERVARGVFIALGCRDLARIDLRLDENGKVNFIECNPLPGLTPGFSDFCVIAEAAGMTFRDLIGDILAPALRRMRERQKERLLEGRI